MNMIKIAVAASLALASGSALAATAPVDTNILYVSGATAPDRTIFEGLVDTTNGILETGLLPSGNPALQADYDTAIIPHVYVAAATFNAAAPGNYLVYGRVKTGLALAGTDIGIGKFSGGSETGIDPVATNTSVIGTVSIVYPDPTSATCSAGTFVAPAAAPADRLAYILFTGCGTTARTPQAGVSDVEPAIFGSPANIRAAVATDGALTTSFAPVVSQNFYTALQAAQNLAAACPSSLAADATEACLPNLTSVQVRALLSRRVTTVSRFFDGAVALTPPAGGDQIRLCRRGNTSGTQQSFQRLFFNQGCTASLPTVVMGSDPSIVVGADNCNEVGCLWAPAAVGAAGIFAGRGSGDVEACVDNANDTNLYAVGLLSTDRVPNDTNRQFRYIKIDGVAPSVERVVSQEWSYFTENVFVRPAGANLNLANFNAGNRASIYTNLLLSRVRTPANIVKTHSLQAFGRGGLTVRPATTTAPLVTDTASTRPVTPSIRAATRVNAAVNNCNEATVPQNDPIKN